MSYKVVPTTEPAGPLYATAHDHDVVIVTLELAVAGLCVVAAARRRVAD